MVKAGFIGWRGMVGSVLLRRMLEDGCTEGFEATFFTTSSPGMKGPEIFNGPSLLVDAMDVEKLAEMDIIISCQGGDYTKSIFSDLRNSGWNGFWLDASSVKRMDEDSVIVLDPVNREMIDQSLEKGCKNFIGGNCTVSLMLMGIGGLFREGLVEWLTTMTYQAASGAGAAGMRELLNGMKVISESVSRLLDSRDSNILDIDEKVMEAFNSEKYSTEKFMSPLAGSLIPWIDSGMPGGLTREEWKGMVETNKILGNDTAIPVDGQCVRVGSMRCHSQALTIKLNKDLPVEEIEKIISSSNEWVELVPNNQKDTLKYLNPASVSGTLKIPVGRVRKLNTGPEYITLFTVGDQLLWGAAEPLKRMFSIILDYIKKQVK